MSKIWTPEDIKKFEIRRRVSCTLRSDGLYDVKGSITIRHTNIESLLDVLPPIHTLNGWADLAVNHLRTLEGSPKRIIKYLNIQCNSLLNLNGAPLYIGSSFYCGDNPDLQFTQKQLDAMNIQGTMKYDPEQLIIEDPREFVDKGMLPI